LSLILEVTPPGLTALEGLEYDPHRPARHCRICGRSYQPKLARVPEYEWDMEVKWAVEILLKEWALAHYKTHPERVHQQLLASGRFMTPEATVKLASLGIYPVQDMVFSDEAAHAGRLAPRAPTDDADY